MNVEPYLEEFTHLRYLAIKDCIVSSVCPWLVRKCDRPTQYTQAKRDTGAFGRRSPRSSSSLIVELNLLMKNKFMSNKKYIVYIIDIFNECIKIFYLSSRFVKEKHSDSLHEVRLMNNVR